MVYRRGRVFFCLLTVLVSLFSQSASAQNTVHIVVRGDTLFSISRSYQVSQEEIMRANGLSDPSKIQIGMRLIIPSKRPAAVAPGPAMPGRPSSEYIVQKNDTLYSIARTHNITVQALRDMNGFSKDYVIKADTQEIVFSPEVRELDPEIIASIERFIH